MITLGEKMMKVLGGIKMSGGITLGTAAPAPSPSPGTPFAWTPNANVTLSNNNYTVTETSNSYYLAYSNYPIVYGEKLMFSVTMNTFDVANTDTSIGFANSKEYDSYALGYNEFSIGLWSNGDVYNYNQVGTAEAMDTAGDVVDVIIDTINGTYYWRINGGNWNNNPSANPTTNTGGFTLAYYITGPLYLTVVVANNQFTLNSTSAYPVPAGFTFVGAGTPMIAKSPTMAWVPSTMGTGASLSNNNLTVTQTINDTSAIAVGSYGANYGSTKTVVSFTMNNYDGTSSSAVGFTNYYPSLDTSLGGVNNDSVGGFTNGVVLENNTNIGSISTFESNGAVIDFAYDAINYKGYWRVNGGNWNNNPSANPATNTGGISLAWSGYDTFFAVSVHRTSGGIASQFTINTTSAYPVPAGFTFIPGYTV